MLGQSFTFYLLYLIVSMLCEIRSFDASIISIKYLAFKTFTNKFAFNIRAECSL